MKSVLISAVVTRWVEVEDSADAHTIFHQTPGIFDGIDGNVWDIVESDIIDEESE